MERFDWTDEAVAILKREYALGLSGAQIANTLLVEAGVTVSRNAVIGKVHRLGLEKRGRNGNYNGNGKERSARRPARAARGNYSSDGSTAFAIISGIRRRLTDKAAAHRVFRERSTDVDPLLISLFELTEFTCKFAIGDVGEPGFGFCGHEAIIGRPYCPAHCAIAYLRPEQRKQTRAPQTAAEAASLEEQR